MSEPMPRTRRPVGKGTVFQRPNGRWVAQMSSGKRSERRRTSRIVATFEEAESILNAWAQPRPSAEQRFWSQVKKTPTCWLWLGATVENGYGQFAESPVRRVRAHRFSYQLSNGAIPVGIMICHHCDVKTCVRPEHLFAGTQADNMQDFVRKHRSQLAT